MYVGRLNHDERNDFWFVINQLLNNWWYVDDELIYWNWHKDWNKELIIFKLFSN